MRTAVTLFVGQSLTLKHSAEDRLASDLRLKGIDATPAYMVLGDNVTTIDQAREKLAQTSYDGLVTMKILDREQNISSYPDTGYWGGWGYGWGGYSDYMYTETKYRVETAAWDLRSNKLVWSAMTSTVDPDNAKELVHDTSEVVSSRIRQVPGPG